MSSSPPESVRFGSFDQLLEAARGGDKEAQGRLLEACRRPLLRLARRELKPSVQAKGGASDVVQETFVKALEEIDTFHGCTPEQLLAWLRVILQHTMANFTRQFHTGKREVAREVSGEMAIVREDPRHAAPSASDAAIHHEQSALLRKALDRLPDHYVQVVRLRSEGNLSFEEIGRLTGRTPEAARQLWRRAVAEVARELPGNPAVKDG